MVATNQHMQLLQWNRHTSTHLQVPFYKPPGKAFAKNYQLMWRFSYHRRSVSMPRPYAPFHLAPPPRLHYLWDPEICFWTQMLLKIPEPLQDCSYYQSSQQGFSSNEKIQIRGQHCRALGGLLPRPQQLSMNKNDFKADSVSPLTVCSEQQT